MKDVLIRVHATCLKSVQHICHKNMNNRWLHLDEIQAHSLLTLVSMLSWLPKRKIC